MSHKVTENIAVDSLFRKRQVLHEQCRMPNEIAL